MRANIENPLARVREERGMTQKTLAEMSGVGESTIQLWESKGTLAASVRNLAKVAEVLDVEITDLLPA